MRTSTLYKFCMAKEKTFEQVIQDLVNSLDEQLLTDKIASEAREICKQHRPTIRASLRGKMGDKKSVSTRPYLNCFYVKKIGDQYGATGYALHNRKYQLSHLLERPHRHNFSGGYTHNDYHFWEEESKQMVKEFEDAVNKIINEQIKKGIK